MKNNSYRLPFTEHGMLTARCESHLKEGLATRHTVTNGIQYRYEEHQVYILIYNNGTVLIQGHDRNAKAYYDKIVGVVEERMMKYAQRVS